MTRARRNKVESEAKKKKKLKEILSYPSLSVPGTNSNTRKEKYLHGHYATYRLLDG
jgi:hypothetical protein